MSNRFRLAAAFCAFAFSSATLADNVRGAWSPPFNWPLIAAHMILTPDGRHLGTILTGQATTNCAFGDDGRSLYITADMYLGRVRLTTKGAGF